MRLFPLSRERSDPSPEAARRFSLARLGEDRGWRRSRFLGMYTAGFALLAVLVYAWFWLAGRTLINWTDGWDQHFRAYMYYGGYLRSILRTLFYDGVLAIPEWDHALGEGNDILQTLHYYVIGDPFALGTVLIPEGSVLLNIIYYDAAILLKLYCAGLAFGALCGETGRRDTLAVLAGAFAYVFSGWGLYTSFMHPFFLNPLVSFPLILWGVLRVLNGKRPTALILSVVLAAVSNFYFLYMQALLTVVFALVCLGVRYRRDLRTGLRRLVVLALSAVLGALMGAVILLPVLSAFLGDVRLSAETATRLFYPLRQYSELPSLLIAPWLSDYWLTVSMAVPALLAIFLLLRRRGQYLILKLLLGICCVLIVFPIGGQLLNGMSYITNRWCWALSLLAGFLLTTFWGELVSPTAEDARFLMFCLFGYAALCFVCVYSRDVSAFVNLFVALLFLMLVSRGPEFFPALRRPELRRAWAFILVLVNIALNGYWMFSPTTSDLAMCGEEVSYVRGNVLQNETEAVAWAAGEDGADGFFRYSGRSLTANANMLAGLSSTQYYWSLTNGAMSEYRNALGTRESRYYEFRDYDDRLALMALSCVRYYTAPVNDTDGMPPGFTDLGVYYVRGWYAARALEAQQAELGTDELTEDQSVILYDTLLNAYEVFRSEYCLPPGYAYTGSVARSDWDGLSFGAKEEVMLKAAVLEDGEQPLPAAPAAADSRELPYTVTCDSREITRQEGCFVTTGTDTTATLSFEGVKNAQTCLEIRGLRFEATPEYDIYLGGDEVDPMRLYSRVNWKQLPFGSRVSLLWDKLFRQPDGYAILTVTSSSGTEKTLEILTPDYCFYNDRHDFCVNLGVAEEPVTSITVTFPGYGVYSFDSIRVVCTPEESVEASIEALAARPIEQVRLGTDTVSGVIETDEPSILCLSIPYGKGWRAWVDGEQAQVLRVNVKNMGLRLGPGAHEIRLVYETPGLRAGACLSLAAWAVFGVWTLLGRRRIRRRRA